MESSNDSDQSLWTEAELATVTLLFKRLYERGCAPVVFYVLDTTMEPFGAFNPGLEPAEVEFIGALIQSALAFVQARKT